MVSEKMTGKVLYKENLSGNVWVIGIEFCEIVNFIPGQYASVKVSDKNDNRFYSVASMTGSKTIELLVDISPMGLGSKYLMNLQVGDDVEIAAFLGEFVIDKTRVGDKKTILFVATGTGIAPIKPMVEDLLINIGFKGDVLLIWGMRSENDLYWLKELDNLHRDFENFKYELVLSKPGKEWPGLRGHVKDIVEKVKLDTKNILVYLCGGPEMVTDMTEVFGDMGVARESVVSEKFA